MSCSIDFEETAVAASNDNLIFLRNEERPKAKLRIFCFNYAGASALSFLNWNDHVPKSIEVSGLELPGHGRRLFDGKLLRTYEEAALYISDVLQPLLDRPYALYGHCLGGVLAFEATRILRTRGCRQPVHLFTSGTRGPHFGIPIADVNSMDDERFIDHFCTVYGASMDVLKNPKMRPLVLPTIRTDAYMTQVYRYSPGDPVTYNITAVAGKDDPDVNMEHMEGWRQHTTGNVTTRLYDGNHFFFLEQAPDMLADFVEELGLGSN
jgi:medium-chain acyl-[acyl-carrier-protein] hydrolase